MQIHGHGASGAVLLEVVLALVLFVAAATIIGFALNTSADGVERLRLSAHGANLASSILSELQMGTRTLGDGSPEPFAPPFDAWMWQAAASPVEDAHRATPAVPLLSTPTLLKVEVTVRDTETDFVYRLSQVVARSSLPALTMAERNTPY